MLDNALISLIISTIIAGEVTAGIPDTPIAQAFQPTNQGVSTQPTAFIYKIADHRFGFLGRSDVWDANSATMVHVESQKYETTFQISVLSIQNPATPTQMTASDMCNLIAAILQSSVSIQTFQDQGVGIERITDVRNPYFMDDRNRFEASPSFDIVFTHDQIISSTTPIIDQTEFQIATV